MQPRWNRNGKERFYISADSKMKAVQVGTQPVFQSGTPEALFDSEVVLGSRARRQPVSDRQPKLRRERVAHSGNELAGGATKMTSQDPSVKPQTQAVRNPVSARCWVQEPWSSFEGLPRHATANRCVFARHIPPFAPTVNS